MLDIVPATFLFVAAHERRRVDKALASDADAVILDLEDAVPDDLKVAAREAAAAVVASDRPLGCPQVWVRVNGDRTAHFAADMSGLEWRRTDGVVLPKAENSSAVEALVDAGAPRHLLLVETVAGLRGLDALVGAAGEGVRLAIGTWDLARDLDVTAVDDPDESELIWHIRCEIVLESRRLKLRPPIDGVCGRLGDLRTFEALCQRANALGFAGKLLIHPEQVPIASRVFGADERRLRQAHDIVAAYEEAVREGRGTVRYGGMLIDQVHVKRAQRLVETWQARLGHQRARG